jgi:O-antigen ligase
VLQDIYPGHRYSNFHSLYVTFFAESGLVALLCILLLFAVPLVRGGRYRALVAGAAVFNVFYQAHAEPQFWVILALAWLALPALRISSRAGATARRAHA